ncbi:MAG: DUF4160 domain-containing protein [Acidobacteria bacterium]|nr:DUF4160 domain-containing protein [Acidobacteriota bacterium]
MPTILGEGPYRFFFFSNESTEPRHVHVESGAGYAKFWLDPVELALSIRYNGRELNIIRRMVLENVDFIKEKWDAYFGR